MWSNILVETLLQEKTISILSSLSSIVALVISLIALYYSIVAYQLKSGQNIRCDIASGGNIESNDQYIVRITLENIKDKASVIFKIYLKFGHNIYLELEDFEDKPLILKPFEVYRKEFDPILFYSTGTQIIKIDNLFLDNKIKRRIILSTSTGKYEIKVNINSWDPIHDFFKNYYTEIIYASRVLYEGRCYGDNVKFIVKLNYENEKTEIATFSNEKILNYKFRKFDFTREALESKDSLTVFLEKQKEIGNLTYESIEIIDFRAELDLRKKLYDKEPIKAEVLNWYEYNIKARFFSFLENYSIDQHNKEPRRKSKT